MRRALLGCAVVGGTVLLAAVLLAAFGLLGGEPRQLLPEIAIVSPESAPSVPSTTASDPVDSSVTGLSTTTQGPVGTTTASRDAGETHAGTTSPQSPGRETVPGPTRYQGSGGDGRTPSGPGPGSSPGGGR